MGRPYSHCSVLFLNIVVTDAPFSFLIPQELNYTVSPYKSIRIISSSITTASFHKTSNNCTELV